MLTRSVKSAATYLHFFWAGLVKHGQTGGIVPSQRFLIAKMIAPVPENYRGQVIELGAGNGALTLRLAARCPEARILACEINPTLARDHRCNLAGAGLNGRVELFAGSAETCFQNWAKAERKNRILSSPAFRWGISAEKRLSLSLTPSTRPSAKAECTSNFSIHCWTARRSKPGSRTCAQFPYS